MLHERLIVLVYHMVLLPSHAGCDQCGVELIEVHFEAGMQWPHVGFRVRFYVYHVRLSSNLYSRLCREAIMDVLAVCLENWRISIRTVLFISFLLFSSECTSTSKGT